jgi:hypothetical protein
MGGIKLYILHEKIIQQGVKIKINYSLFKPTKWELIYIGTSYIIVWLK